MKNKIKNVIAALLLGCSTSLFAQDITLKDTFKDDFLVGTAFKAEYLAKKGNVNATFAAKQFNSAVAENCMKIEKIHPKPGIYDFVDADKFMEYAEENDMFIIGHTLIWHSQCPDWMFEDENGDQISRDALIQRMKDHIYTVVGRYKGRIDGWDVVNEAIADDKGMRKSKWQQIIGDEYIELAFQFAHEADPNAELYYNDYSMAEPHKREMAVEIVKRLQKKNIRIDAIGMQAHMTLDYPKFSEFEKSIEAFHAAGVQVMLTELDITVLPFPSDKITAEISQNYELKKEYNPYPEKISKKANKELTERYKNLFKIALKHNDKISRVTLWGINDGDSWRNKWPIKGRKDYPLLFDRGLQPKDAFNAVVELKNDKHIN